MEETLNEIAIVTKRERSGWLFTVTVSGPASQTEHQVTLAESDYTKLTSGLCKPEDLVEKSFIFLLEHEPKESILRKFDLTIISRYFPAYTEHIRNQLLA